MLRIFPLLLAVGLAGCVTPTGTIPIKYDRDLASFARPEPKQIPGAWLVQVNPVGFHAKISVLTRGGACDFKLAEESGFTKAFVAAVTDMTKSVFKEVEVLPLGAKPSALEVAAYDGIVRVSPIAADVKVTVLPALAFPDYESAATMTSKPVFPI